jgi:tRNA U34 2-thiouridine synthase MnmA/TrmU
VLLTLAEPVAGVAPGQLACLMEGETIVGHGTIAARRRAEPAAVR